jgi:hypothetical protein
MQRWVGRGVIADNPIMSASPSANRQPNSSCPHPRIILRQPRPLPLAGLTALPPIDHGSAYGWIFCAGK